jgi:signal transduction histidine kinase
LHQVDVAARPERVAPIADDITSPREGETSRRSSPRGSTTWLGLRRATYVVVALAMTLTLVTALLIRHVNADSERRQLHQRTHEASVVLESLIGTIEGPMQIGGQAFDALGPQQQVFDLLAENATGKDQIVAGAAIVQVAPPASAANPRIFMRTSGPLALAAPGAAPAIGRVRGDDITLIDLLQSPVGQRLGVALPLSKNAAGYVLYVEMQFPMPGVRLDKQEAFSDLKYAVYLGATPRPAAKLFGTASKPIDGGNRASQHITVGNSELLLVAAPSRNLNGGLAGALPWLVLLVGIVGTACGAAAVEAIGRRRDAAILLAGDLATRTAELIVTQEQLADLNASLEDTVEDRTRELQAANRELESFAYAVSHDLRAPLRAIDGFGLALLEDCGDELDERGRDYLRRVRAATQRMGELIDDILTLSRVSRAEMNHEVVDLSALARGAMARLHDADPDRDAEVVIASDVTARGDARLLRIALDNLLGNAWKFTSTQLHPRVEFGLRSDDAGAVYYVRDNGTGFDPRYANKLFKPFQRLHTEQEFEGNGIGLATVARVIDRHGGRVWAEGEPGKGATFFFTCGDVRGGVA